MPLLYSLFIAFSVCSSALEIDFEDKCSSSWNKFKPIHNDIFVDFGANYGSSISTAIRKGWVIAGKTDVFAFEPNAQHFRHLVHLFAKERLHGSHVIPAAVWTEDTILKFYVDTRPVVSQKQDKPAYDSEGSSLFDRSKAASKFVIGTPIVVCAVNSIEWLKQTFTESNNVTIKMDIEGAEFEVLELLLNDPKALALVDRMVIEWHGIKIRPDICCPGETGRCQSCPKEKDLIDRLNALLPHGVGTWDE